jgi:hypothetical protein
MHAPASSVYGFICGIALSGYAFGAGDTYVLSVFAIRLGYGPEFYEALVVTKLPPNRLGELPSELKKLCADFPQLDSFMISVVTDPALIASQAFRDFQRTYVIRPQHEWRQYRDTFVASYAAGELTLFPVDADRTKVIQTNKHWCTS